MKALKAKMVMRGRVIAELRGPDGKLKQREIIHNLVTDQGDIFAAAAMYTGAYSGWGMKLGTASTAASKSGAGAFIAVGDYVAGSNKSLDNSTPKAGAANDVAQFRRLFAAGEGTSATINRVSIVDNTDANGEADESGTYAIAVFGAQIAKGADDTLTVTWDVTYDGS